MKYLLFVLGVVMGAEVYASCAPGQVGCLEIVALNGRFISPKHDIFRAKVAWEEQVKRAPTFWQAYHKGQEQASKARTFDVIIYSNGPLNIADIAVYRANGRQHQVTKMQLVEVTGKVQLPVADKDLGTPRVFRITAEGDEAFVASIQLPYAMVTNLNYVTVCQSDRLGVVPNRTADKNESYGISKETLGWFVSKGQKRLPLLFLSADG